MPMASILFLVLFAVVTFGAAAVNTTSLNRNRHNVHVKRPLVLPPKKAVAVSPKPAGLDIIHKATATGNASLNHNHHIVKGSQKKSPKKAVRVAPNLSGLDTLHRSDDPSVLCGGGKWEAKYSALHARAAKILNSVPSEQWSSVIPVLKKEGIRVFIYIAREGFWHNLKSGGVGDRFSLVGMFAMSLAHNTAFFLDYPGLSDVFDQGGGNDRGIAWSVNATGYIEKKGYSNAVLHFPDIYPLKQKCGRNKGISEANGHFCRDTRLDDHISNNTLTIARTARGKITVMFKEKYYKHALSVLNLKHGE
jgi:hypothetical protein